MVSIEKTAKRHGPKPDGDSPKDAGESCVFCRRPVDRVTLVVRDPEHGYSVCADCIDDCARTVACSCVC